MMGGKPSSMGGGMMAGFADQVNNLSQLESFYGGQAAGGANPLLNSRSTNSTPMPNSGSNNSLGSLQGAGNGNVSRARGLRETWKNGRVSRPVEASAPDRAWSCCTRLNGQKAVITSLAGGWPCFGEAPRRNCGIQGGRKGRRLRSPRSSWRAVPEAQVAGSAADGRTDVSSPRSRRPPSRQGARGGCARRASREARAATRRPTCTICNEAVGVRPSGGRG